MIRIEDTLKWETAKDGHKYHPAKIHKLEDDIRTNRGASYLLNLYKDTSDYRYKHQIIPCGQCIGCRLDYSRNWANRGSLETKEHLENFWITLTYDDEHLPKVEEMITSDDFVFTETDEIEWKGCLFPKDLKNFIDYLRKIVKKETGHTGIRFIASGEYGERGRRPHFHIILFNCPLPVESFYESRIDWKKDTYWKSDIIDKAWGKGIAEVGEVNWETIAYTCRYITKKINGKDSEYVYAAKGQIKEFLRTSRMPGIARNYYEDNKIEIYKQDKIPIIEKKGLRWEKPPKYFDRLMETENPELMEEVKENRKKAMLNALEIKAQTTSLNIWDQLQVEREYKEDCTKTLKRSRIEETL